MEKLDVKVLVEKATTENILEGGFDAAIIACGAAPMVPDVPGIDNERVVNALQVFNGSAQTGQKIAVIGAGVVGVEVGLFLADNGKEIAFFEMTDTVMNGVTPDEKQVYGNRLAEYKAPFHTGQRLESITDDGMIFIDRFGKRYEAEAETIVLACGLIPDRSLYESLSATGQLEVFEVGDCVTPRKILDAIREGHIAAKLLD